MSYVKLESTCVPHTIRIHTILHPNSSSRCNTPTPIASRTDSCCPNKGGKRKNKLLLLAINRSSSDRAWAVRATSKDTLREALDELVFRIDGRPSRLVAAGNFFSVRPNEALTQANLAEYFFKVLDSGKTAGMNFDVIAIKFLQHVPLGHKTYT